MANILTYVLHYEGAFNKNSLGAVSEAARLASETGGEAHALVLGGDALTDELVATLGGYGATKVFRAKGPEGLAQPVVDAMAKVIADNGHDYALFGGGLLGFEIGAGLAASGSSSGASTRSRRPSPARAPRPSRTSTWSSRPGRRARRWSSAASSAAPT